MTDKKCVIASTIRDDQLTIPLFWSNDDGWVSLDCASIFSESERQAVPLPQGAWGWVGLPALPPGVRLADRITIGYDDAYLQSCASVADTKLSEKELVAVARRFDTQDTSNIAEEINEIVGLVIADRTPKICPKYGEPFWTHHADGSCVSDSDESKNQLFRCDNCDLEAPHHALPSAKNLHERLYPGEIYTDVECADDTCGALCFPVDGPHTPAQSPNYYGSLPVLGKFGDAVLDILQDDEEWNSDTFQKLNDAAFNLKLLSSTLTSGEFVRKSINEIKALDGGTP